VEVPSRLWVQLFFHSLGVIPKSWYTHEETRRQTSCWKTLKDQFCRDFSFTGKSPELHLVLQRIQEMLFTDICKQRSSPVVCSDHVHFLQSNRGHNPIRIPLACCKIDKGLEESNELEELRNLNIKETEGTREIQDTIPSHTCSSYNHPLKLQKVNIGSEEHPKIASIGDYWDEKTMNEVQSLLREYEDLFPKTFSELKGIKGAMGEMKIELKPDSKPMKHRPYHLNPKVKEKVKKEVDKMLAA
jgi:hypothetical protein